MHSYLLKKIISLFLMPLMVILIVLFIGLVLSIFNKRRLGLFFTGLGFILLLITSSPWAGRLVLVPLESDFKPLLTLPHTVKYIVVLGGGALDLQHQPPTNMLSSSSLARLVEGIRLYRQLPSSELIVSGGSDFIETSRPNAMKEAAIALGVDPAHIIVEDQSIDTQSEAKFLKPLLKESPFILVTSAYHMKRAYLLFEEQGMHPIPAPCDFIVYSIGYFTKIEPSAANLDAVTAAMHEYLGLLRMKVKEKYHV